MIMIPAIAHLPAPANLLPPGQSATAAAPSFAHLLASAVNQLSQSQATAQHAITQAMLGTGSVTGAMVAMTQAQLTLDVATSVTGNAQTAYQTIMNMPLG